MTPTVKAPASKRLKLKCDERLPNFAFKINLRRYQWERYRLDMVGRCRLTVSRPVFKAPIVSTLDTVIGSYAFNVVQVDPIKTRAQSAYGCHG